MRNRDTCHPDNPVISVYYDDHPISLRSRHFPVDEDVL
jgi:hypothetical protein